LSESAPGHTEADAQSPRVSLTSRINTIEEAYEFMLAYAAQGLAEDAGSESGGQVREFLDRAAAALTGLDSTLADLVKAERLEHADQYGAFQAVLERDAGAALAAIALVLVQPSISSQLVDNLNASIHVRALLTDLFLLDELLKSRAYEGPHGGFDLVP
jgi:hypothetical protein